MNLALHQPVNVLKCHGDQKEVFTDRQFVESFIAPQGENRHLVFLEGATGVGKSHLVVWTQAKLEILNRNNGHRFIIIRIPRAKGVRYILNDISQIQINGQSLVGILPTHIQTQLNATLHNFQNTVNTNDVLI